MHAFEIGEFDNQLQSYVLNSKTSNLWRLGSTHSTEKKPVANTKSSFTNLQMMNSEKKNFHIWILLSALVGRVC